MTTADQLPQRRVSKFGWRPDLPDPRDFGFQDAKRATSLPLIHDLWLEGPMPSMYDQLQLGACTGNGWARVMDKLALEQGEPEDTPSRMFIYQNELIYDGVFGQDVGAQIRDGARVVANLGVPSETIWPYDLKNFTIKPPQEAYDSAKKHEALQYQRINLFSSGAPMRSALVQGYPIVFGFPVPDYFEGAWSPGSEVLQIPGRSVQWIGGHCVVVTGYDFSKSVHPDPYFICDNSWGPDWGMKGRFMMDYKWFTPNGSLASDLWIVKKVS